MSTLIEYLRGKKNRKKGLIIAMTPEVEGEDYLVGYSLCHEDDKFDPKRAVDIATHRAMVALPNKEKLQEKIPNSVRSALKPFLLRCDRYFKGNTRPQWCPQPAVAEEPQPEA